MRTSEALAHRFLASDSTSCRHRENIRYSSTRLRRTTERRFRQQIELQSNSQLPKNASNANGQKSSALLTRNPLKRNGSADFIPRSIKT